MAVIKCKMCGGDIEISPDKTFGTCEYCGSTMTFPKVSDDQRAALFNRGNHFRRQGEFDKALSVYENIVREDDTDAEAHWCCALCRFGIEYVEDPATLEYIPTCHRASFDSFLEDVDYLAALNYSDGITKRQYQKDAMRIAEVQKGILATSQNEEPFDVFICYKETDENGERTRDSLMAQDIYYQLTEQGLRVFFARITLEDKVGAEYEPYIFAALHSAKVMVAVGTTPEHFNAVWVKNEWSRFIALMKKDRSKLLIPCYRDMDPYDLPEQLSVLQSYDMSKIGFIQDLIRGIEKLLSRESKEQAAPAPTVIQQVVGGSNAAALLKRGNIALEDGEWEQADGFFDEVLNQNAECVEAYLGKAMATEQYRTREELYKNILSMQENKDYRRALKFADDALKKELEEATKQAEEKKRQAEGKKRQAEEKNRQAAAEKSRQEAERLKPLRDRIALVQHLISAGDEHTVGLKSDGTAVIAGSNSDGRCKVSVWRDIVAVSAGSSHTVGLKSDGTVVVAGSNNDGRCKVSVWRDIVALSAGDEHTVGLKSDGTVVAAGSNNDGRCEVSVWRDIVAVSAGGEHTVGLKSDGTVVAAGNNDDSKCKVSDWRSTVIVSAGAWHTVSLKSDGTVVAAGSNRNGQCEVSGWSDIVAVSAGLWHTVGLKSDGTVVAVGSNDRGQCKVSNWRDIVAVSAGYIHTVGLKSDGTVIATGENEYGQCEVSSWKLFNSIDTLEQDRIDAKERLRAEAERRLHAEEERLHAEAERRMQGVCRHCGGKFKGLLLKKCEYCGRPKDY